MHGVHAAFNADRIKGNLIIVDPYPVYMNENESCNVQRTQDEIFVFISVIVINGKLSYSKHLRQMNKIMCTAM